MIVTDASLLAHLLIPSSDSALAEGVYRKDPEWSASVLWRSELRSVLLKHIRHSGMDMELAKAVVEKALLVIRDRETLPRTPAVLEAAVSFKVSAYDAEYLVLARQLGVPLLTFDRKLQQAAPGLAIARPTHSHRLELFRNHRGQRVK
jgi:predicted nucleic acid-binding protein